MKSLLFSLALIAFLTLHSKALSRDPVAAVERTPCLMVIFIHGTIKPAKFSFSLINTVMHNKIQNSLYEKMIFNLRKTDYLYQSQTMQGLGLLEIDSEYATSKAGARCMVDLFEMQYNFYQTAPPKRLYYTFGWNGLLSVQQRLIEGRKFYTALEKEVSKLRRQGYEPRIHINAYSYGGAVALNLATAKKEAPKAPSFCIDQLVLLATPVQRETDHCTADIEFFKKIFHFYSTEDHVQAYDMFSTRKELFSRSIFTPRFRFSLPKNLTQVRIRLTKKIDRIPASSKTKPEIDLHTLLAIKGIRKAHRDPGHTEFWNLYWGDSWYRSSLPTNPLPIVTFVPTITYLIHQYLPPDTPRVTFDYCPAYGGAYLTAGKAKKGQAIPFLTKEIITSMKNLGKNCVPEGYSLKERRYHELQALKSAHEELKKNKTLKKSTRQKLAACYMSLTRKIGFNLRPNFQKICHSHLL